MPAIAPSALRPPAPPPGSPAAQAQRAFVPPPALDSAQRLDDVRGARREVREGDRTMIEEAGRVIIREGGRTIIRHSEDDRFRWQARDVHIERRGAETFTVFDRPDGSRIYTVTDESGRLLAGLRRGDAVRFGRQHVRDGIGTVKTEKSGYTIAVTLPILPVLAETLAAGPCGDLTFIAGESGQPLTKESFGNLFKDACRAAGVPGSAHGVRKIAATRAANRGATVAQLEAIFGWCGGTMASLYTRSADRKRLAIEAMYKLANDEQTSIPAPCHQVRALGDK